MRRLMIVAFALCAICAAQLVCYASNHKQVCVFEKTPVATSPAGAVIECIDCFVGKIASAFEIAATGERKISVRNETGECRVFPFTATTKIVDGAFNALTFNQLKTGKKVTVEYTEEAGIEKAQAVIVEK